MPPNLEGYQLKAGDYISEDVFVRYSTTGQWTTGIAEPCRYPGVAYALLHECAGDLGTQPGERTIFDLPGAFTADS